MGNKFRSTDVQFQDTRNAGGITVRGIYLEPDEKGLIEGPADLEQEIKPHGFYRVGSAEHKAWLEAQPKPEPKSPQQPARR